MENPEQHLLADLEVNLQQAGSGQRLANYLIDVVVFYILVFVISFLLAYFGVYLSNFLDREGTFSNLENRLLFLLIYGLYMGAVEAIFKGKSIGKLVTRTRAVNEDGSTISTGTAFIRGIIRAVPFNAFSALGSPAHPWHDRWTKTFVIDEAQSMVQTEITGE